MAKRAARHRLRCAIKIPDDDQRKREIDWAVSSESRYHLEAAITLARSEEPLADDGTSWDADPWLLGVANGVVELRTGKLRKGILSDRITMHARVSFNRSTKCPRWESFLKEIFGSDEVIDYIQKAVGYSLTGETREQCLFCCYGEGANGKTTFLEAIHYALGAYAQSTPFSTLELKGRASIPNDVAALDGRRFVTAVETSDSVRLNEARLKGLTGSDTIAARFFYKEFFEFRPIAKVWLAFNHKPVVADDSHGFWRRIRLIPFPKTFTEGNDDKQLLATLQSEAPGILAWAVRGCVKWQAEGLGVPPEVQVATRRYREESDPLLDFLDECCVIGGGKCVAAGLLWNRYRNWVKDNGEPWPIDRTAFARRLETRGLRKARAGHARTWTWLGISLKTHAERKHVSLRADERTDADVKVQ